MIIICPSCKKKFNIDINLIPSEGRDLQCGSCEHIWFYKKQEPISEPLQINEDIAVKKKEDIAKLNDDKSKDQLIKQIVEENKKEKSELSVIKETKSKSEVIDKTKSSKFFSYLTVFIISLGALIILLDTLKTPLINIFPGLEVLLFNLYETLKDIKLFIIDLS
ncbi:zinc-ribbon domain-containing protein [Pelagibacterales bacterium SAG-MED22]|nr:zinc-ribbon domain-containing protein [Pelagibacterales bacterium SAG-MED22]